MRERERCKKQLRELKERKKKDSSRLREMKRGRLERQNVLKKEKLLRELPRLLSTRLLLKQWKSKDWHMKKKRDVRQKNF